MMGAAFRGRCPRLLYESPAGICKPTAFRLLPTLLLRAPARAAAIQALIAGAVADHDGAAIGATGSVVALVDAHQASLAHGGGESTMRRGLGSSAGELGGQFRGLFRLRAIQRLNAGILAGLRVAGQKLECHPAEDVIHDGLGIADFRIGSPAAGLKARMAELIAQHFEGYAVLQSQRHGGGETVHEP